MGSTCRNEGVNFSLHSPDALSVDLLLFDSPNAPKPDRAIPLDSRRHRTGAIWHVYVPGLGHGQIYAWRVRGPRKPADGLLFDGDKVLIDPYGRAVCGHQIYRREWARNAGDNTHRSLRSVVVDMARYDWENDRPLPPPGGREIIYEMHLAGFTKHPNSGLDEDLRGTYAGCIAKIPYLKELGVTTVELLPVHQFDPQDSPGELQNYWGYSTLSFFAPHAQYSQRQDPTGCVDEFRDLVKALHRAGLRVILDVVYNHTTEGGPDGPTLSFRGLDNPGYYLLNEDRRFPNDFTGCGNTLNANGGVARRLIMDSLRFWVSEMHVDGFRFDLACALTRAPDGSPMARPPLLDDIESDPVLAGATLIAEPWDVGGLFQVGTFPGDRVAEWNGRFEDTSRSFWRGDEGTIESLMARIVGSPDLYCGPAERPHNSINYVTVHDGFCLADLVSYAEKHNLANGEDNRDGSNHNLSCNHGTEGPTDDPEINALRSRQIRNFLTLLFLSHGTPLLNMGDEIRHTRQGNNNPWNQDSELSWLDWDQVRTEAPLLRFVQELIRFTSRRRILQENRFWKATNPQEEGDITWHGQEPSCPDWRTDSHFLGYGLTSPAGDEVVLVYLNASDDEATVHLPEPAAGWTRVWILDTALAPGQDIHAVGLAPVVPLVEKTMPAKSAFVVLDRHPEAAKDWP